MHCSEIGQCPAVILCTVYGVGTDGFEYEHLLSSIAYSEVIQSNPSVRMTFLEWCCPSSCPYAMLKPAK